MVALVVLSGIYILMYCASIFALVYGFSKVKTYSVRDSAPKTTFSIIVPFRTEEKNLPRLLNSIKNLDYPAELFELIFIDDASEDFSANAINKWRMENGIFQTTLLENIRLSASPKKDAITRAVPIVKMEWIVTTDADCRVPTKWLRALNDYIQDSNAEMIAGPVRYDGGQNFLHHFQRLDFMSLQGTTIGSFGIANPFMCNGANLAYTKRFFTEMGGFAGNMETASGDDVFLLQKAVRQSPEKVHYIKASEAIVDTIPAETWGSLFHQRVRWAGKAISYNNRFGEDIALVVLLANFFMVLSVIFAVAGYFDWKILLLLFIGKLIPDWVLLYQTNIFLNKGRFFFPLFSAFIYPFFCVVVAVYCLFGKYKWKGRIF